MRLQWALLPLLGVLADSVIADLAKRQTEDTSASVTIPEGITTTSTGGDTGGITTTTSTSDGGDDDDTTVTVTTTVEGDGDTVSTKVTKTITSTKVVTVTSTTFSTTTETRTDEDTATTTVYETSTVWASSANAKRAIKLAAQTLPVMQVDANPTTPPVPAVTSAGELDLELVKKDAQPGPHLAKRDTITVTNTVTEGGGSSTVVDTVTKTVVTTASTKTTTTNVVTETEQANASTTVTVTSTLTVTSTSVTTGVTTETGAADDSGDGDESSSDDSGGLSTAAKAGIGAGVGVAGLAVIAGLAWFCLRKRRRGPKHNPDDDMFGASEVPVGGAAAAAGSPARRTTPMSHQPSNSGAYAAVGRSPVKSSAAPEGYRGTAMGDGRAGYAKPDPYGAAYTRQSAISPTSPHTSSHPTNRTSTLGSTLAGGDQLPEHSTPSDVDHAHSFGAYDNRHPSPQPQAAELGSEGTGARWQTPGAAEMDSSPAPRSTSPPQNVYEMPAQNYR